MFRLFVLALCLSLGHGLDDEACGVDSPRVVDASEPGTISSPGYDDDEPYPADSSCEWLLQGEEGQTVEFKLLSVEIELCTSCRCDVLKIYDGDGPQHLLGEVCGNQGAGQVYQSSGQYGDALYLVFESDDEYHFSGFFGRYGYPFQEIACTVDQPEMMTSDTGVMTSPDWPAPYADNSECSWHIAVPEGQVIVVNFGDFDVEDCCLCDFVEFFDGEDATAQRIGRYYGRNTFPPNMMSSGNHMYVNFRSDVTINGRGFSVRYQAMPAK